MKKVSKKVLCLLSSAILLCGASAIPASAAETAETTTAAFSRIAAEKGMIREAELDDENELVFEKALKDKELIPIVTTTTAPVGFEDGFIRTSVTTAHPLGDELLRPRRTTGPFKPRTTTTTTTTATTTTTKAATTTVKPYECKLSYGLNTYSAELSSSTASVALRVNKNSDCVLPPNATVQFQWYKGNAPISGATSSVYTVKAAGYYYCKVTVSYTENSKTLTKYVYTKTCAVTQKLEIATQPKSGTITNSSPSYTLSVTAKGGTTPYSYEWTLNGTLVGRAQTYKATKGGTYKCKVTDSNGKSVTSSSATVTDNILKISKQPQAGQIMTKGGSYTLSVAVSGGKAPYKYKWTKSYSDFSRTTASISVTEQGTYQCEVTDSLGNKVKSDTAYVSFGYLHFIEWRVWGTVYSYDKPVELYATPRGGTAPYRYQWTHDGYIMPNTTAKIYVTEPGTYYLTVYDAKNTKITSEPMTVYQSILRFTTQPKSVYSDDYGSYTTLSAAVTGGTGTYSYEWQKLDSSGNWVSAGSYRPSLTVYRSDTHTSYTCDGKMYGGRTDLHYLKKYYTCYRCVVKTYDSNGNVVTQVTSNTVSVYDNVKDYITDVEWAW